MIQAVLDGDAVADRADLHAQLAALLAFPDWYGKNLDALYDCLTDPGEERTLQVRNPDALTAHLGQYGRTFLRVLRDAGVRNPRFLCELIPEPEG